MTASRPLQNDWVAGLGDRVTELRDSREVVTSRLQLILDHHLNALRKRRHESPIGELLLSQRRWGSTRCRKFLVRNQISETKRVGTLTERQRRLLAQQLCAAARELALATA